ncbi:hypothetical protein ACFFJX_12645 [Pseudarcicella hirudinis]|uniref:hypothetical protein n=1 Tax=Pseudarcicella hirudinis TaxID=1079859 RepID=UPI0035EB8C14
MKIAGKVYDSLTVTSVPTTANGGVISGDKITIPVGSTGYTTALQKNMLLTSRTDWSVGSTISFAIIINEYSDNASNGLIAFNLHKKSGSVYDYNKGVNKVTMRLDARTVRLSLDYTIESGVTELDVYLQVSNQVAISGADVVFEWKAFWCLSSTKIVTVNPPTDLLSQINTLVASKDLAIADKLLYFTATPTGYSGQALNGALLSGARLTVPTGQSGNTAYVSYVLPTTAFINIADMVGNSIVIIYKIATSTNLTTIRSVSSGLNVVRSGSTVTGQGTNKTITVLSPNVCLVSVTYTVQAGDTQLTPFIQLPTAAGVASADQYVELQDLFYTMSAPIGFPTLNEYVFSKIVGKISTDLAVVTSQVGAIASVTVTKTVKPDGTGDYLSPKLAMDAITDSSITKRYEIIVYPGTYTEVEWTVKPYCYIIGTNRSACWLKGELPDSATDAQISGTSTVWLKKTGELRNLTITIKNGRYAIHQEDSGNNAGETM